MFYKEISDEDIMNDMMWYDFIFIDEKKDLLDKQEYLKKMILLARKRRKIVFNFNTDEEFRDDRDKIVSLIESVKINKDDVYFPKIKNSKDVFIKKIEEGLHRLYGKEIPLVVLKRINEELYGKNKKGGIINSENESIYLIYKELVLKSKQLGYTVIPRGYVASSFVAYLIGITNINPLVSHYHCLNCGYSEFNDEKGIPYFSRYAYGVLMPDKKCPKCKKLMKQDGFNFSYEMFLGSEATFKPNININFALEIKNDLIHYLEEKLGKNKVLYGGVIGEKNNKKVWGIHPGSIFLVPQELDIFDFTPVAYPCDDVNNHLITYLDYREVIKKYLNSFLQDKLMVFVPFLKFQLENYLRKENLLILKSL